ncbi:MAG: PAS domain S-box protein, partial [Hymenobacter sp.]
PWGLLVLGAGGTVQRLNRQAAAWWGLGQAAAQGQPVASLPAGHLPAAVHAALQQLAAGGTGPPETTFFVPARQQWLSQTSTRQAGETVVYWHDVTQQKLRENQYQTLADSLPDVLSRWDQQLRLQYANPAFVARSGRPLAELLGCTTHELGYAASLAQPWVAALQQAFATGQPQEHHSRFPTPEGDAYYYSRLVPEVREGVVVAVLAVGHDITMRHAAEARFRTIADMVPGLLWRNDAQGNTNWYNQRWFDYTGQTLAEAKDYGWLKALHPDDRAQSLHNFQTAVRDGQPLRQEHRLCQATGEYRWFQVQALPVYTPQGNIAEWLGAAVDIHERRLTEDALRQSEEKYRTLFETMDEGFAVCELLRDAAGQPTDMAKRLVSYMPCSRSLLTCRAWVRSATCCSSEAVRACSCCSACLRTVMSS